LRAARQAVLPEISLSAGVNERFHRNDPQSLDFSNAFGQLDVAVDLDLFGRLRSARNAAAARVEAAALEHAATRVTIEADVAAAFVQYVAIAERTKIHDDNIARAVELERVIRARVREGASTRVELGLQSIRLLNLRKHRADLTRALNQTRTALALLTGAEAPSFEVNQPRLSDIAVPHLVPPSPRALLASRADLRASEALLQAAAGDAAQARAKFFPDLGLSIQAVLQSATGGVLGRTVTGGSSLLAPIFSRGRLEGELHFASAVQIEAAETYRRAILTALAEVQDAQAAVASSAERAKLIESIVEEARLTSRLARVQYIEGEEDLQVVLDAEQWLNDAEDAQVLSWQERQLAQIALYRASGGFAGVIR
jgi:outer membrane protein, multidrug efflux system